MNTHTHDTLGLVKTPLLAALLLALQLTSCQKPESATQAKHYSLTGRVVSISLNDQTASIDGAAIPNYMGAMTMDYPIKSKDELQKLRPGDLISATVNVGESSAYNLSDVKVTGHGETGKK